MCFLHLLVSLQLLLSLLPLQDSLLNLKDLLFKVTLYLIERFFKFDTNMSFLRTKRALHENAVIIFFEGYFLMNFVIYFESFMILKLSYFSKIVLFEEYDFCETSRSDGGLCVELTEETNFSKILIHMKFFDIGMGALQATFSYNL